MEEKLIIKSEFFSLKPFKIVILILCGLVILGTVTDYVIKGLDYNDAVNIYNEKCEEYNELVLLVEELEAESDEKYDEYQNARWYDGKEELKTEYNRVRSEYENAYDQMSSAEESLEFYKRDIEYSENILSNPETGIIGAIIVTLLLAILFTVWMYVKYSMIVITNKRVVGKMLFGRIDIPLDSIASISRFPFFMITVKSIRGKVRMSWLKNRNELYDTLCDLLVARQPDLNGEAQRNREI